MHPVVKDHFQSPRNVGDLDDPDVSVTVENPVCGDVLKLDLRVRDGRIAQALFRTLGCTTAIAASSMLTTMLEGRTWKEALAIRKEDISRELGGLPPSKLHCSVLGEDAIKAAARAYRENNPKSEV